MTIAEARKTTISGAMPESNDAPSVATPIAMPPSMGIDVRCQRSCRGCATRPSRYASRRHSGTSATASTKAIRNG